MFALAVPGWRRALGLVVPDGAGYAVGDRIDVPVSLYESAPVTLLVFTRSGCGTCQRAKSAMATLAAALRDRATVRVTMVVADGTQADERKYLHDIGLTDGHLAGVDFRALRLQRVPTTVLVDRTGRVLYSLEGVLDAAVVGVPDELLGQVAAAFVTLRPGFDYSAKDVLRHCAARLENFMVPQQVRFLDEFPRTATGKIDKLQLAQLLAESVQ